MVWYDRLTLCRYGLIALTRRLTILLWRLRIATMFGRQWQRTCGSVSRVGQLRQAGEVLDQRAFVALERLRYPGSALRVRVALFCSAVSSVVHMFNHTYFVYRDRLWSTGEECPG